MRLKHQYQEIKRLKKEINQRLNEQIDFTGIKELMLYLAKDGAYAKVKSQENQLAMLEWFFNIWLAEKKKLPDLGIKTDIFYKVSSLEDVEKKYHQIEYCGLRIENAVPDVYCEQSIDWLMENKISGLAIGKIVAFETWKREDNLLHIAQRLRKKGDSLNALLLMQFANEKYPGQEKLLLEEADIWFDGNQFDKALELLMKIEKPSQSVKELMIELQQVVEDDG